MLIRRLVLVVLFLVAQAGALAHGIGHAAEHEHEHEGLGHKAACELCMAYAPLGAGMAGVPPIWVPPASISLFDIAVPAAWPSVLQITRRNRGPPRLTW